MAIEHRASEHKVGYYTADNVEAEDVEASLTACDGCGGYFKSFERSIVSASDLIQLINLCSKLAILTDQRLQHANNRTRTSLPCLPSAVLATRLGHATYELSPSGLVFCVHEDLVLCVSGPLEDVVHPRCFRSASLSRSWRCSLHYLLL